MVIAQSILMRGRVEALTSIHAVEGYVWQPR
jgi:hypothetical protein